MNAALIEDHLTEAEDKMSEKVPDEDGLYLVVKNGTVHRFEQKQPPSHQEIKKHVDGAGLERIVMIAMEGVSLWVNGSFRILGFPASALLFDDQGGMQDDIGGPIVITRVDRQGRIRLLRRSDVDDVMSHLFIVPKDVRIQLEPATFEIVSFGPNGVSRQKWSELIPMKKKED